MKTNATGDLVTAAPDNKRKKSAPAPTTDRGRLSELGQAAAWVLGLGAVVQIIQALLRQNPLMAAVLGAVLVDIATSRSGFRQPVSGAASTRPALWAGALGLGIALLVTAIGTALGMTTLEAGTPSLAGILSLVRVGAIAVRDELLLRGLPIFVALRIGLRPTHAIAWGVLVSPAALLLAPGVEISGLALAACSGALFSVLWIRTKTAVAPVAAHAAFFFVGGILLRGELAQVAWDGGVLTMGARAHGAPAWMAALLMLGAAWLAWRSPRFEVVLAKEGTDRPKRKRPRTSSGSARRPG